MNQPIKKQFALTRYVAGIDPDCTASGFVVYDRETALWPHLCCLDQPKLQQVSLTYKPDEILFSVEAGWLNPGIWHGKNTSGWDGNKAKAYGAAIGKAVGRNFDIGHQIIHFLRANGYPVEEFRPKGPKWKAHTMMRETKLPKGYNQEIRDAVRSMWDHIKFNF